MQGKGERRLRPSKGRRDTERHGRTPAARTTAATTVTATAGETAVTAGTETAEGAVEEGAITAAAVKEEEEGSAADTYRLKLHQAVTSGSG